MASITKRENKSGFVYKIQVKIKDKGSGKDIVKATTWQVPSGMTSKTAEREVIIQASKFEESIKKLVSSSADGVADNKLTFKKFASTWLDKCRTEQSASYYVNCVRTLEMVYEYIGGYKLTELTPRIIQSCYDNLDKKIRIKIMVIPKPDNVRAMMKAKKIRHTDLEILTTRQAVSATLRGKCVELETAEMMATAIKCKVADIYDVEKEVVPYAYETIHKCKRTVRAILAVAKRQRLIDNNYATADYITFPKKPKTEIEFLNDIQAKELFKVLKECTHPQKRVGVLTVLLTGMRKGELCGLEWRDIDFEINTLKIERSRVSVATIGVFDKDTKTDSSDRELTMPQTLVAELKEYKLWQDNLALKLGDKWENSGRVFTSEFGGKIHPSVPNGWLSDMTKKAGLPHASMHSLRHTNITLQIAAGVPLVTVSGRAGHARTSTTTDIYSHFLKSSDAIAADKLDSIFG